MNTRSTPISFVELTAVYPSLFALSGGERTYGLNGSGNSVNVYLPAPTTKGTVLRFFAMDISNTVQIKAKSTATIHGSTTETIELVKVGDCVELVADEDGTDWKVMNFGTIGVTP